ncbi:hypothetical protein [Chryseobacterium sp. SIMBA_038]|uniref:hypothetical protein n=2 Tax=Pseudomonadati TaxID=3379134 RepID=UPI00397AFC8D
MKKIFYLLFALSVMSCGSDDDIVSENQQQTADLSPEKALVHYMEFPKIVPLSPSYYTFNYENDRLIKMNGKMEQNGFFSPDAYRTLSYNNNKVELKYSDNSYTTLVYTMENGKPKKSELYIDNELVTSKSYTYESNKVMVYEDTYNKNKEVFITYLFDSNQNLIKSEKLEKAGGVDKTLTTTNYSNFDQAKNPFKKLSLINDNLYEKSLSINNYRKVEGTVYQFYNPNQFPPGSFNSQWTYQYDNNGQVLLYHSL